MINPYPDPCVHTCIPLEIPDVKQKKSFSLGNWIYWLLGCIFCSVCVAFITFLVLFILAVSGGLGMLFRIFKKYI